MCDKLGEIDMNRKSTDINNPEWTEEDFKKAVRFEDLPESLRKKLSSRMKSPKTAPAKKTRR